MSKQLLIDVFERLVDCEAWSMQLVQIKNTKTNGTSYICREVEIQPNERLLDYVKSISEYYSSNKGISSFSSVDEYTGEIINGVIYKLHRENMLISNEFELLIQASSQPDRESDISEIKANASVFNGIISLEQRDIPILLISMQKPMTYLNNRFLWIHTNTFKEIAPPIITLRKTIDVAIIGDTVYFFSLAGEKLFGMERAYKAVCKDCVDEIVKCSFITDIDSFKNFASSGRNPRRFVAFNNEHFEWLKKEENRRYAAEKFGFLLENDRINTSNPEAVDRLVKFLCNKAMIDPCDERPVEVATTKPWS